MVKLGLVQTASQGTNQKRISAASKILDELGSNGTQIACLPEQWLRNNEISDFDVEFADFKNIAEDHSMTIITGAFYDITKNRVSISAPIIGPKGEFIGKQEKIHPFDYERDSVKPGNEVKIFDTACKFGIVICYDMVFPNVANTLAKKGAQVLFSPSRIIRRGIEPWQMYVKVRSLENRIPILAANVESQRFGGNSMIVDLSENNKVMTTKITKLEGEEGIAKEFKLSKYEESRKNRFKDSNKFH